MSLNHKQKRYIKKNIKSLTSSQIAKNLNIPEEQVMDYLKERWGEDKFKKQITINLKASFSFKNFFKVNLVSFLFLALLVFITYINSINNDFVSDDVAAIFNNKNLGDLSYVTSQPLNIIRLFLYYIINKIGGLNPVFYRIFNILFHLGSVWLVYLVIHVLTAKQTIAFLTASIFAVHPILIESVVWISGGVYAQYSFFLLASLLFYILSTNNVRRYAVSLAFFILALFSSEKAIVFPFMLFLYELCFSNIKKRWKNLMLFFTFGAIFIMLNVLKIGQRITVLETESYMKMGNHLSPINLILTAFIQIPIAIGWYLKLIFWPVQLAFYHSDLGFTAINHLISSVVFILLAGLTIYFYKKNKLISFWLMFFIVSLLPTLTPLGISWLVAERYVYIGSVGIIFAFSYFLNKLIEDRRYETFGYLIFILIVIALITRTITRNIDWKNEDNLWIATGKSSPSDQKTHNNLGDMYARHGDYQNAEREFKKAIEINPYYADAYHNLANTYIAMNKVNLAFENYQKAAKINPKLWQSFRNLSAIYYDRKDLVKAKEMLEKAVSIVPQEPSLYLNLGALYFKTKDYPKAKKVFLKALEFEPENAEAKKWLERLQNY